MDSLIIKDLLIMGHHGLFPEEKALGQKFLVSCEIKYNIKEAGLENKLEASINYGQLCQDITRLLTEENFDLIETCAYKVLDHIFRTYPIAQEVEVSIKKPWAPIGLALDYPEVVIRRKKRTYFIGLGSNMGPREENLSLGLEKIESRGIKVTLKSSLYETPAWGLEDQADFLNQAAQLESYEEPQDLLRILASIEDEIGRVRAEKWGPRPIDLDMLFAGDEVIYTDSLKVPHPYIEERTFVLEPMNEIAPFFVHPVLNTQIRKLYQAMVNQDKENN